MENLVVSGVVKPLLGTLASMAVDKFAIAWGVQADLQSMSSMLSAIQAVLQEAEEKQWKSPRVKDWLGKLKDVAYDADNAIDEFATEAAIWKVRRETGDLHRAGKYFLLPKRFYFRLKIGEEIKKVNRRLADLDKEKNMFGFIPRVEEVAVRPVPDSRVTTSAPVASKLYGQDGHKKKVIDVLLNDKDQDLLVYAIYGMGGLGKTTLAKSIFNDPGIGDYFSLKIWVCISENYDIGGIIKAMLESIDRLKPEVEVLETLQLELRGKLSGKRFLLILDDVWNEDRARWVQLENILKSCGAEGSAVVLTTRMEKIAVMMANSDNNCLPLSGLSEEDSWSLFQEQAIGKRTVKAYMERIGKELLKKCCGVPLAINALGSVMSSKLSEDEWKSVEESEIWSLQDEGKTVLSTLGVSFYHLSPQLRQCFLYCCVFPKDDELDKDDLIRLWMACGFIPRGSGQRIFDELVSKSFIQDVEERDVGFYNIRTTTVCKIHDLMHDLGSSIMGDDCFNIAQNMAGTPISSNKVVRHLYFGSKIPSKEQMSTIKSQSIVSFLGSKTHDFVIEMKHLRVLRVKFMENRLLKGLSRLTHLRYLDLSYSDIAVLPESIIHLQNLQSLNLQSCNRLSKLPKGLDYLKNLSYLNINGCSHLENMPDLKYLSSQQMQIDGLVVRGGLGICSLKQIEVCGSLSLKQLHRVKNPEDAREADIKSKAQLRDLQLEYGESDGECDVMAVCVGVMEALQPPPNLRELSIYRYPGSVFPRSWWVDSLHLQKLTRIVLSWWGRCENLRPLEKLPLLDALHLGEMPSLKFLVTEKYSHNNVEKVSLFPALRVLSLSIMRGLEGWMATSENKEETDNINSNSSNGGGVEMFMNLEELDVTDCDNLMIAAPPSPSSSIGAMKMTSLTSLWVQNYKQLVSFCQLGVRELDYLRIDSCLEDDTPPLQHLISVRDLVIVGCERLTTLPVSFLGAFDSITELYVRECRNLTTLPDGLLNNDNLKYSLAELSIHGCPKLDQKKCREGGEYWPLVSHIPKLNIY